MGKLQADEVKIAHRLLGKGDKTIVIDTALGTCSAEWWHIAEKLSEHYSVLTFDRPGYGKSPKPLSERSPQNIAAELDSLLTYLGIRDNIILLGHSQGGFYSMQYALTHPEKVVGMLLLDPATPYDDEFSRRLTKEKYQKSGVDKTSGMKLGLLLSSLKLGFLIKPMLKKMPPFYYFSFSKEAEEYLLGSLCRNAHYTTALDEYKFTHIESAVTAVKAGIEKQSLGSIPLRLVTHSSDFYCKELQEFGNMDLQTAAEIENIWQEIMKRTLNLSADARHITAANSGHSIHLTEDSIIYKLLREL